MQASNAYKNALIYVTLLKVYIKSDKTPINIKINVCMKLK